LIIRIDENIIQVNDNVYIKQVCKEGVKESLEVAGVLVRPSGTMRKSKEP
jgi:hypothetical protein